MSPERPLPPLLRHGGRAVAYGGIKLIDHLAWLLIHTLPGPTVLRICRQRPWQRLAIQANPEQGSLWLQRVRWVLKRRSRRAPLASTCLSRSLTGRLLLDLLSVPNELHLGMTKGHDGRKTAHAWLSSGEVVITPGLETIHGSPLIQL
jgi:hypothetical protein